MKSVARAGFALIDHVNGQSDAVLATQLLDPHIRAAGARTAELMVWPSADNTAAFDAVRGSYQAAAQVVDGLFLPAGEAWRSAWALYPMLQLYGSDGFHPSELGTYLTALVVYEEITGRDTQSLPPVASAAGHELDTPPGVVRLMQRAAHETVTHFSAPSY